MVVKNRILLTREKEEEIKRRKEEKRRKKVKDSWLAIKGSKKRRLDLVSQSCDSILNKKNFFKRMLSNRHTRVFFILEDSEVRKRWRTGSRMATCLVYNYKITYSDQAWKIFWNWLRRHRTRRPSLIDGESCPAWKCAFLRSLIHVTPIHRGEIQQHEDG